MKKDKKWAQKEVDRYLSYEGVNEARNALAFAKGVIDQLDEPEVLSSDWIDKNKTSIDRKLDGTPIYKVREELLQNLLMPKQDKPVIPKFVADWVESRDYYNVYKVLQDLSAPGSPHASKDVRNWIFRNQENVEKFVRAWLDGYEVEKEQKYQMIIRDGEYIRLYLCKNNGNVTIGTNDNYIEKCPEVTYLTEQEIKDYDERFWPFAVKVEELEE